MWGQQPTVANFLPSHLEDRKEEMDFVMTMARLRLEMARPGLIGDLFMDYQCTTYGAIPHGR